MKVYAFKLNYYDYLIKVYTQQYDTNNDNKGTVKKYGISFAFYCITHFISPFHVV